MNLPQMQLPDAPWPYLGPRYQIDPGTLAGLEIICQPGAIVLDVGCNVGLTSVMAALAVGPDGRVVGFDGNPAVLNAADDLAACNELGPDRLIFVHALVGESERDREPFVLVAEGTQTGSHRMSAGRRPGLAKVRMTTLDAFCLAEGVWPTACKVDVEGGEAAVLEGAPRLLAEVRPTWLIELHDAGMLARVGSTPADLGRLLSEHGYRMRLLPGADEPVTPAQLAELAQRGAGAVAHILARPDPPGEG